MQRRTPGKNRLRDAKGDGLFDAILTALLRLSLCTRMRQLCGLLTILPWPRILTFESSSILPTGEVKRPPINVASSSSTLPLAPSLPPMKYISHIPPSLKPETKSKPKAKAKPNMTKYNLREDGSLRI
ncbi:hypothetical protein V2W45_1334232 [Cenococcum geophilum]